MAGQSTTITITAVTGSSLYTKQLSMSGTGNTVYVGANLAQGNVNLMSLEDQAPNGRNAVSRTVLIASGLNSAATTLLKFEYFSMGYLGARGAAGANSSCVSNSGVYNWQVSYEFHRIFIDGTNDVAYILSNTGDPGGTNGAGCTTGTPGRYIQFSGAGKPIEIGNCSTSGCSSTIALRFGMLGQIEVGGSVYNCATTDYNACVNAVSRNVTSNDTLSCDISGTTINSGAARGVIELSRQFFDQTTGGVPNILSSTGVTTGLSWTGASDIFTTATAQ